MPELGDGELPTIDPLLVKKLEEFYPNRCPDPSMTDREIWIATGAAQVVALLRHHHDMQNDPEEQRGE